MESMNDCLMFGGWFLFGSTVYFHVRFKYSLSELKFDYLFAFGLIAASLVLG